jgi:hypothetical protein
MVAIVPKRPGDTLQVAPPTATRAPLRTGGNKRGALAGTPLAARALSRRPRIIIVNHLARSCPRAGALFACVAALAAIAGCNKVQEGPAPPMATVVMPGGPAPVDAVASAAAAAPALASSSALGVSSALPPAASASIVAGDSGPATGGTVSVISGANPTPAAATAGTTAPTSPLDPTVLPPALSRIPRSAGAIGPDPSASASGDYQPLNVAPGSKP